MRYSYTPTPNGGRVSIGLERGDLQRLVPAMRSETNEVDIAATSAMDMSSPLGLTYLCSMDETQPMGVARLAFLPQEHSAYVAMPYYFTLQQKNYDSTGVMILASRAVTTHGGTTPKVSVGNPSIDVLIDEEVLAALAANKKFEGTNGPYTIRIEPVDYKLTDTAEWRVAA